MFFRSVVSHVSERTAQFRSRFSSSAGRINIARELLSECSFPGACRIFFLRSGSDCARKRQGGSSRGGPGGMLPGKLWKSRRPETPFPGSFYVCRSKSKT